MTLPDSSSPLLAPFGWCLIKHSGGKGHVGSAAITAADWSDRGVLTLMLHEAMIYVVTEFKAVVRGV